MPSQYRHCSWQVIFLVFTVLGTDIAVGHNTENTQQATETLHPSVYGLPPPTTMVTVSNEQTSKQSMDLINTDTGMIRLQPPPPITTRRTPILDTTTTTITNTMDTTLKDSSTIPKPSTATTRKAESLSSLSHTTRTLPAGPDGDIPIVTTTGLPYNYNNNNNHQNNIDNNNIDDTFYDNEYGTTTLIPDDAATLLHPLSSDALTKGFTIPTFLPPMREFAVADLPSYTTTTTTAMPTTLSDDLLQQEDQLYFSSGHNRQGRRNLTLQLSNVSVQIGNHAYMPCNIRRLQNKPVSWVRVRDGHILSVDQTTFIADQRFQSIFNEENEHTWSLQIKYAQKSDEGWYECQVATEPKMSAKVFLEVVVPTTELIGDQNRFVKAGSKVELHCIIRGTIVPPTYIIWYHDKTQIMDDKEKGWYTEIDRNIFGNASDNQNTIGSLIILSVRKKDSGNYTCQPANSAAVSVDLHVLSGEYSASAIMSAASIYRVNFSYVLLILLIVTVQKT